MFMFGVYLIITLVVGMLLGGFIVIFFPKLSKKSDESNKEDSFEQSEKLMKQVRESVTGQLLNDKNTKIFAAIARQREILLNNDRKSLAIFLSQETFKSLLYNAVDTKNTQHIESLYSLMKNLGTPVGFLGDLPIYVSEVLTDAPVQVVGSITWEI